MKKNNNIDIRLVIDDGKSRYRKGEFDTITKRPVSQVDQYLQSLSTVEFNSTCFGCQRYAGYTSHIKFRNELRIGVHGINRRLYIELFNDETFIDCIDVNHCYDNIKSGKCHDPFVVEHIGRVFFAKKYEK